MPLPSALHVSLSRRGLLLGAAALGGAVLGWGDWMAANAAELRRKGRACILLWMQGGPSQFETFSPLPGHENGGETKAIDTVVPGIQIAENLPRVAEVMDDICLIRSMTSKEGSHPRATFLMQTGYLPTPTVKHPALGAHAAQQLGDPESELPDFVRVGARGAAGGGVIGGGLLGVQYDPFAVAAAGRLPNNAAPLVDSARMNQRLGLLGELESSAVTGGATGDTRVVADHQQLYTTTSRMMLSPKMKTFELDDEPATTRAEYGDSEFGAGCLLARRLVEAGVTFIEVNAGNWDTHQDNFERCRDLCGDIDQPIKALLQDLKRRGLLDQTLVLWMGEFGRTPRINARGGRDHFPRAFNVALAGGGVRGGQVIGATDAAGESVTDRPVTVPDLFRTICHGLQLDPDREHMSSIGRPIKVVDGGELVPEVFG